VLEPGGRVSGFMFFEDVPPDEVKMVSLHAELVDAPSGRL
jgi:hypothetical protein